MKGVMGKRVAVITGAEGFIGSNLVRELLDLRWRVIALHRPAAPLTRLNNLDVELRACDVTVQSDLKSAIPYEADALFHLAADLRITHARSSRQTEVNVEGTRNVLQAAIEKRCRRFLLSSSMGSFGLHDHRIDEKTVSNAMTCPIPYFRSKYLAEAEVDKAIGKGLDAVIVNPTNVVGPRDTINMPATYIRLIHNRRMPVIGQGAASFCHVREVARAMIACIELGRTGERYLLGGADATFVELGHLIERFVGGRAPRIVLPPWMFKFSAEVVSAYARLRGGHTFFTPEIALVISSTMLVDCSKAVRELDYKVVSLEEMFRDEVAWLQANGMLEKGSVWVWS